MMVLGRYKDGRMRGYGGMMHSRIEKWEADPGDEVVTSPDGSDRYQRAKRVHWDEVS
jgi:hypothetical protein